MIVMLLMLSVVFPALVSVADWGGLEEPTRTEPKFRLVGLRVGRVTVTAAEADLVVLATEVAVTVTKGLADTVAGAV